MGLRGVLRQRMNGGGGAGNVIDVASYGAAPGTTVNAPVQAALNQASVTDGGGVVVVTEPGTYWLSAPTSGANLTLNSALLIGANTALVCAPGVVFKLRPESVCYMIRNSNPTINGAAAVDQNILIEGGTWDGNATFCNVIDATIASDGVTITSSGFNGYSYTSGDAAYIWWASPSDVHTGASSSTTTLTSTSNFTGAVVNQTARLYTATGVTVGNYTVSSVSGAPNSVTLGSSPGTTGSSISFELAPVLGQTSIASTNGTNQITLASSVGVAKTGTGFINARVTIMTQQNTPAGGTRAWQGHGIAMWGVNNLTIRDITVQNCGKYEISISNATNVLTENLTLTARKQGSDGIHFNGPIRGVTLRDTRGITDDNLIGFTPSEGTYFGGGSAQTGGTTSAALSGGFRTLTKTGAFASSDVGKVVTISSGTGVTAGNYTIQAFTDANNVLLATDPGASGSSVAFYINGWAVTEAGEGNMEDIVIDGVYGDTDTTLGPGYELVRFVGKSYQYIKNVRIYNVSGGVRKGAAIKIADDVNGQLVGCVFRDFLIDGVDCGSEYAAVYIPGTGTKDVVVRNVWCKEQVLLSLTNVSTAGTAAVTAANQFASYTGIGLVANAFQSTDQVVFTSGANSGGRFFIDNTVSGSATAPVGPSVVNVFSTFPVSGTGQTAEIRRNSPCVWVDTGVTMDSLVVRDSGARDSSNVNYGGYVSISGAVRSLVIDGMPMLLGNGATGIVCASGGSFSQGVFSRISATDNGSGNSYAFRYNNTSTRSYLTLTDSMYLGAGGTLRAVYSAGPLDLTWSNCRMGGHTSVRPIEVNTSADVNIFGDGLTYQPNGSAAMVTAPYTITAGALKSMNPSFLLASSSVTVNNSTGTNTLYTPAAGLTGVATKVVLTVTAISSPSGTASVSVGITGAGYTDVVGTNALPNFDTVNDIAVFHCKGDSVITNSAPLTLNKSSALGSGSLTVRVDVYGYLR